MSQAKAASTIPRANINATNTTSKAKQRYFGTDGIRGQVGQTPITPELILRLGWAAGRVFAKLSHGPVLIGKDTRISGYLLESLLEAGLISAGVDCTLLGPMPTPAVAYLTKAQKASAGCVISASHNPYQDNGIKFFAANGKKLADDVELMIEAEFSAATPMTVASALGKANRDNDAVDHYIDFCLASVNAGLNLSAFKIALDCAHGANYHIAPKLLTGLQADLACIGVNPNGVNINANCGSTQLQALQEFVLTQQADLGIAFDGDGDRVLLVDQFGEIVDGDEILYIIAKYQQQSSQFAGGVVGTVMSNLGFEHALRELGIEFVRAKVGDRFVMEQLTARHWQLGGETSGHIICLDKTTTGDGIIAALQVLAIMATTQLPLHELKQGMRKYPQVLHNVRLQQALTDVAEQRLITLSDAANQELGEAGRVLLRPSGTEPLLRVMVEGDDAERVEKLASQLAAVVTAITTA